MKTIFASLFLLLLVVSVAGQTPAPGRTAPRPAASTRPVASHPDATLAQLMRGVLFPSSNVLFDVQANDPATPKKKDSGAGSAASYNDVYAGWPSVEGAAAAIEESADLMLLPGRLCSNGKPAPVTKPDYIKFASTLRVAGSKALAAANAKNRDAASDSTNDLADACESCHAVYRDKGPAGSPARCAP